MALGALVALGSAACGDNGVRNEVPPAPTLGVRTDPASAAECPAGGSVVSTGIDANRNGVLDDAEVTKRTVVCNDPPPKPPPKIVVRLVAEPIGEHCALGGTAVQSGPDRNDNGVLDADEVTHIDYACGETLLTRLAVEPPGLRCIAGGVAFLIGRDRDRDGELGADEVEQIEVQCGDRLSRDVAIHSAGDAAALANILTIDGSLTVDGADLTELSLPQLVQVRGDLEIAHDDALTRVALAALQSVDGRFALVLDRQLTALELPGLHRVGSLRIDQLAALQDLGGMPALTEVAGDVQVSGNGALAALVMSAIRVAGDLAIDENAQLARIVWPVVASLRSIHVGSNPQLTSLDIVPVGVGIELGRTTISSNAALRHASVPADLIAAVVIEDNPSLTELVVSALQITGDLQVRGNGALDFTLAGVSLFSFLIGGTFSLSGPVVALHCPHPLLVLGDCNVVGTRLLSLDQENQTMQCDGALHVIDNELLATMPLLQLGGGLEIRGNPALRALSFLFQDQIDGDVVISDNATLRDARSLEAVHRIRGNVTIASNPALKGAFTDALERIDGDLALSANDSLDVSGLTKLQHVRSLALNNNASVAVLDLAALSEVTTRIDVRGNAALQHILLPVLRQADMGVFDNPRLPACEVEALF
ncbi:MAG TPA: hypothetical protein VGD80_01490, partial [Kofleriaceae bacterium]